MQNQQPLSPTAVSSSARHQSPFLPYIICILAALFYLYEFILQVSPSVLKQELMHDLQINAVGFGMVSAAFYVSYMLMQVPAGLLYDRYGPRLLLAIAIFVCAGGTFFFGFAQTAELAALGRFLIGIGSAFSFIGALVLVSRWFPPHYFAVLAGLVQFMSSIGAITGEVLLADVVSNFGWRESLIALAIIGLILAVAVWMFVRDRPEDSIENEKNLAKAEPAHIPLFAGIKELFANAQTWRIALYAFMCWAPVAAFAALWGVPYIATLYGISTTKAAAASSLIWLGVGIGSPLIGFWSDYIDRRCLPLTAVAILGFISLGCILYIPSMPFEMMCFFLFCFGLAASGQSLTFALIADSNRPEVVGTGMGFNNMAVVAGGMLFQPLIGLFMQWGWNGQTVEGVNVYTVQNYRMAMLVLPLCYVVACFVSMKWLRETHCRPQYSK